VLSVRCVVLMGGLLLSTGVAHAQSTCPQQARADTLEAEGLTLREAHRDAEALQRFEGSWALCHGPRAMVRRGLAEWALGRWLDAEEHIVDGLSHRDDAWVTGNQETITRSVLPVVRRNLGSIELSGAEGRGEVWIGNRRVSDWPMTGPARVLAGENVVMVRAAGFEPWRRVVMVPAGGLARESVDLVAMAVAVAVVTEPTPAPRPVVPPTPHREPALVPATTSGGGGVLRALAWTSSALALAAGGTALATGLVRGGAVSDFEDASCESPADVATQQRCQGFADRRDTMGTVAVVSGVAAGVFAVGAVVAWVSVAGERTPTRSAGGVGCAPTLGGVGVGCIGRF